MSRSAIKALQAAAGAASGGPTYVDDVFSTYVYTGVYSNTDIVNGIDLAGEGGLVWTKKRNSTRAHDLSDTARGVTKSLYSSNADAQGTDSQGLLAFNSNGYRIGGSSSYNNTNDEYVSWTFRKQPGFFDVVTYTPSGSPTNVSHNLGSTPGMIIIKNLSDSRNWAVWHRSLSSVSGGESGGSQSTLKLNLSDAIAGTGYIQSATSTQFTVSGSAETGTSSQNYVAYLFAHDAQDFGENSDEAIIKCGYYTGNTSTKPNIDLGFEPQWVMIKCATHGENWIILDSMRGIVTPDSSGVGADARLLADSSNAETTSSSTSYIKLHANGFELTGTGGEINAASRDYIYMAIRRPHKPASEFAATDLYKASTQAFTTSFVTTGFPVDLVFTNWRDTANYKRVIDRIRGDNVAFATDLGGTAEENPSSYWEFDHSTGFGLVYSGSLSNYQLHLFRRAPGFLDIVGYTGNSTQGRTVAHNLTTAPDMIWIRSRSAGTDWVVYAAPAGATKFLYLNYESAATSTDADERFNDTAPTASVFSLGNKDEVNYSGRNYMAYLFGSVAGISKIGSYTGTGSDINVDCGFSAGARFVMVKGVNQSGGWYVWDSNRGIVAGNDPYYLLNAFAIEVTNTDYIDPLSSGFTITSSAPAALNSSGKTYLFWAIA